jgi:monoamine oxidase
MTGSADFDIVIMGGGAAGIGAARTLAGRGLRCMILEAAPRLGGRAWTYTIAGFPLDLGCGWLHSADRNPWAEIATSTCRALDCGEPAWGTQFNDLGLAPGELAAARDAFAAWSRRLSVVATGSDNAADALDPQSPWNDYIAAICGFANGVRPERMSARDYLAYDEASTGRNWRATRGYGDLIAASTPIDVGIRLATPIDRVRCDDCAVELETANGTLRCDRLIVTVSTSVLAAPTTRWPAELDPWRDAAMQLPLGRNEKIFLETTADLGLPAETHLFGDIRDAATAAFYVRPFGWPVIETFLGGEGARVIEEGGVGAGYAQAVDQLAGLLGNQVRKKVRFLAGSDWARSDHILGAYSCAMPGKASARARLARPFEGRIFFAGEATHPTDYSTAHGAFASGVRAATELLQSMGNRGPSSDDVPRDPASLC